MHSLNLLQSTDYSKFMLLTKGYDVSNNNKNSIKKAISKLKFLFWKKKHEKLLI